MWMNTTDASAEQWEREDEITKDIYRGNFDALLAELRQPSEAVLIVGAANHGAGEYGSKLAWQAMIDAIGTET